MQNKTIFNKTYNMFLHRGFQRYFQNTSWLIFEKILRLFSGLFVGIWVARYLMPGGFGNLSYAQSFAGLFTAISGIGLDGILVRELLKNEGKKNILLGTAFILKIIGTIVSLVMLMLALNLTDNTVLIKIMIFVIAASTLFQSFNVIDFYFQSQVLSAYVVFSNIAVLIVSSIIKIVFILINAPLIAFAVLIFFESVILALGLIYFFYKKHYSFKEWRFEKQMAKKLLSYGWSLIFSGIAVSLYLRIDQVMIKSMLNSEAVGQYAAAVKLSEAWYFVPVLICQSLFPAILNARKTNVEIYKRRIQGLYDLMVCISLPAIILVSFLAKPTILFLYGQAYSDAGNVLSIHIWSSLFVFLGVASSKWFIAENLQLILLFNTALGAAINIALNYIFIPIFGIQGAAWSTLISQSITVYLLNLVFHDSRCNFSRITNSFNFLRIATRGFDVKDLA